MPEPLENCDPEFIDGSWHGCGDCPACLEQVDDDAEFLD